MDFKFNLVKTKKMIDHQRLVELYGKDAMEFFYKETEFLTDGLTNPYEGFLDSQGLPCPEKAPNIWQPDYINYLELTYGEGSTFKGTETDYTNWLKIIEND